ncbi:MAG: molecular chaperone DnaJ [Caulobacteraceae bacterium]|nr:molecular chaperone DnaJ [Caulobacteraceae bacterium]
MTLDQARRRLGVGPGAGAEALRQAFRQAVKAAHPDRPGGDGERLRQVIDAYGLLRAAIPAAPAPRLAPPPADPRLEISAAQALVGGWGRVRLAGGREVSVRLPAGLRAGEPVRVSGETFKVLIANAPGAAVAGDDYLMTAEVARPLMETGGRLLVETPAGGAAVWISRTDAARGFARVAGMGLPARGGRRTGDLLLRLKPASDHRFDTPVQAKRRRFAAAWAA